MDADGKEVESKRFSQVLFAVLNTMETDGQLIELLSETPEVPSEVFAEAAQAAKDFGLKTELQKVTANTCTV